MLKRVLDNILKGKGMKYTYHPTGRKNRLIVLKYKFSEMTWLTDFIDLQYMYLKFEMLSDFQKGKGSKQASKPIHPQIKAFQVTFENPGELT